MGDSIPNRRPNRSVYLPSRQSNCLRRTANKHVCTLITGTTAVTSSFQCSGGYIQIGIHLRALSDGGHHPAAQFPTIQYSRADSRQFFLHSISITGSRLAMHANLKLRRVLVFWDWKRAQLLFVSQSPQFYSGQISSVHLGVRRGAV